MRSHILNKHYFKVSLPEVIIQRYQLLQMSLVSKCKKVQVEEKQFIILCNISWNSIIKSVIVEQEALLRVKTFWHKVLFECCIIITLRIEICFNNYKLGGRVRQKDAVIEVDEYATEIALHIHWIVKLNKFVLAFKFLHH